MPRRPLRVTGASEAPLRAVLAAVRTALDVPGAFRVACTAPLPLGERLRVRLTRADPSPDPATPKVRFAPECKRVRP